MNTTKEATAIIQRHARLIGEGYNPDNPASEYAHHSGLIADPVAYESERVAACGVLGDAVYGIASRAIWAVPGPVTHFTLAPDSADGVADLLDFARVVLMLDSPVIDEISDRLEDPPRGWRLDDAQRSNGPSGPTEEDDIDALIEVISTVAPEGYGFGRRFCSPFEPWGFWPLDECEP